MPLQKDFLVAMSEGKQDYDVGSSAMTLEGATGNWPSTVVVFIFVMRSEADLIYNASLCQKSDEN